MKSNKKIILTDNKFVNIGALAVILAASLWGVDQVVIRQNLFHIENLAVIVFLEHFIAFLLMSTFCWYGINEIKKLNLKDWASFFWVALFGGAIGTIYLYNLTRSQLLRFYKNYSLCLQ
jgi:drug/metabolite transporter (DMT)-like permease